LLERLNVRLSQLSPRQQQIFILSRLHGHSYLEIAEKLGVSLSTVQKELKLIMTICMGVAGRSSKL
jgi:RNA polymerase sigma factor (sigma-70 family)